MKNVKRYTILKCNKYSNLHKTEHKKLININKYTVKSKIYID